MTTSAKKKRTRRARRALLVLAALGAFCLIPELVLRLAFGLPRNLFGFTQASIPGLYAPNATIPMIHFPIPYTVETNSLGFRGPEITAQKTRGSIRIAAVGDSITDGFGVDNPDTYPRQLEAFLARTSSRSIEVINTARGGGTIDEQLAKLRKHVLPLDPDIVILTFVTNDITDLRKRLRTHEEPGKPERVNPMVSLLLRKTAVGEALGDLYLRIRAPRYRSTIYAPIGGVKPNRYRIQGGRGFAENCRIFTERFRDTDGTVLHEPFSEETERLVGIYRQFLGEMANLLRERGIRFVFVYFPSYPQVYDPTASFHIRDLIRRGCETHSVPFIDLTPALRAAGKNEVLHLAPVDYHPNPQGNRVIAQAVGRFLMENDILGERPR